MIASPTNPVIKQVRALQTKRREREREQAFVIEGVRLFEEAARARATARLILHTEDLEARARQALAALAAAGGEVRTVTPAVMAAASATETPSGLLAVVACPTARVVAQPALALVLDGLADPGNLGTILRTADAAGVSSVYLAPGTVDAFNPKVVRAAMGAHFHLPIIEAPWEGLRVALHGLQLWVAEAGQGQAYTAVDWRPPSALVIGAEAEGPSPAALASTPRRVHIPMPGRVESLNAAVAAGVLLFEIARQKAGA